MSNGRVSAKRHPIHFSYMYRRYTLPSGTTVSFLTVLGDWRQFARKGNCQPTVWRDRTERAALEE